MKIGVAIPTFKRDIPLLNRCLKSISKQSKLPEIVVISASSCKEEDVDSIDVSYSFPIKIIPNLNVANAATNRNCAANYLLKNTEVDIISFIDSDDEMHFQRLEFLEKAFIETQCNFIVHDFILIQKYEKDMQFTKDISYICYPNCIQKTPHMCLIAISHDNRLSHGHVSILKTVWEKEKFNPSQEFLYREDCEYCSRLVDKGYKGSYIKSPLSIYHNYRATEEQIKEINTSFIGFHTKNEYLKGTPKSEISSNNYRIFICWTGDNELSPMRKDSIENIKQITKISVILINKENLNDWILSNYPLHKGYPYLSSVHKADYLKCYFMHHYGGGFTDIKKQTGEWITSFERLKNSDAYCLGYQELSNGVAIIDDKKLYEEMNKNYMKLIGNGAYIFESNTEFTNEWYNTLHKILDEKYEQLKNNPATDNRDYYGMNINGRYSTYPIRWTEILGNIFHPLCYKYQDKILQGLPVPSFENYL